MRRSFQIWQEKLSEEYSDGTPMFQQLADNKVRLQNASEGLIHIFWKLLPIQFKEIYFTFWTM